ncbi:polysaccharide pyruvyl transferase family protein [Mangrovibacterium lignilyticum]|uniref:polysaccharide pyruvyl transferase family protein n=1 Tax=Mangrovibacterium lignilyticum TaxID=2668052 RepID=UPI0013D1D3E7|nr:polysaccharide pyruvyl transferase family protein [Mangrovibacterium lignilyticum]
MRNYNKEKIQNLRSLIEHSLTPLIDNDYIYLDLPYHNNIGDILIWKGTEEFLTKINHNCLYRCDFETYKKPKVDDKVVILLHGGGNIGDIWHVHSKFRKTIIESFPNNKIIILPQTVHYEHISNLQKDVAIYSKHKHITICARDNHSYSILTKNFNQNKILNLPDMAFCISEKFILSHYKEDNLGRNLFFKRKDREFKDYPYESSIPQNIKISEKEWPSMDHISLPHVTMRIIQIVSHFIGNFFFTPNLLNRIVNWYAYKVYMPFLCKIGIKFISSYSKVYSTRLHGAILSILTNRPIVIFDNSYGKNRNFCESWLQDFNNVDFVSFNKD